MNILHTVAARAATRLGRTGLALALPTVGLAVAGAVGTTAAPAYAASGETINYSCTIPVLGTQTLTVTISGTAPTSVAEGQTITLDGSASVSLPSSLLSSAQSLGATGVTINSVTAAMNATGPVTPTTQNATATGLPATYTISQLQSGPVTQTFAPLTFTAGNTPGTVDFTPGNFSTDATIQGGTLNGYNATITCTAPSGVTPIASVQVTSGTSVPVGAVGGVGLAALAGVGFYAVQRRRSHQPVAQ